MDPQTIKPPETVEELMKEENRLLRQIVHQNQHFLSRTAEILEQNHQFIKFLMKERNQNTKFDLNEKLGVNDDPLNTEETQFEEGLESEKETEAEWPYSFPQNEQVFLNEEDEEDVDMKTEENQAQPGTSKELQILPAKVPKNPHSPIGIFPSNNWKLQIATPNSKEGLQRTIHFPISTLSDLTAIDKRMEKSDNFKRTVLDLLKKITLKCSSSENIQSELVDKVVIELKVKRDIEAGVVWRDSLFLKAAKCK